MDKRKKFTIIFDTETTFDYRELEVPRMQTGYKKKEEIRNYIEGTIESYEVRGTTYYKAMVTHECLNQIFDIGWTVCSIDGTKIYEKRNFLVSEVFTEMKAMQRAFYFNKFPEYLWMLNDNKIKMLSWIKIKQQLERDILKYRVNDIWAYNSDFDSGALNTTNKFIYNTPFDLFEKLNVEVKCLWSYSCDVLLQNKKFIELAKKEKWLTPTGNIGTSAEVTYRYLTQNYEFIEDHTALSDSLIETHIYKELRKRRKGYTKHKQPWRLVREFAIAKGLISTEK